MVELIDYFTPIPLSKRRLYQICILALTKLPLWWTEDASSGWHKEQIQSMRSAINQEGEEDANRQHCET